MQVSVAINDFAPLLRRPDFLFAGLKKARADGIELGLGFKSRWSSAHFAALADKYGLPIVSMHQPLWSGLGLYFDEGAFRMARHMGVKYMVCHPLPRAGWRHPRMRRYLSRLADMQEKTGVRILLENMPPEYDNALLGRLFPVDRHTGDLLALYGAAQEFGLQMALDTDHAGSGTPHQEQWFRKVLPQIGGIHLSSFHGGNRHLPLGEGELRAAEFVRHLRRVGYNGLLTLEVNSPKAITLLEYDFSAIQKSIELIKSTT